MLDTQMPRNSQRDECEKLTSSDEKRIIELEADIKELASALRKMSVIVGHEVDGLTSDYAETKECCKLAEKYLNAK